MSEDKQSYQKVMKATTLFGGVQVVHILISIIRSKVLALLLGPEGTGIAYGFNTSLRLINAATNLGLDKSAVKEIAALNPSEKEEKAARIISVLKRLVWFTATAGALVMIAFSSLLSKWTFSSSTYTLSFIWLALALVFNQLAASRLAILQGFRKLEFLAKSNLYGAISGLLVTIPLYYFLRLDGILPAIVLTAVFSFLYAIYFAAKIPAHKSSLSISEAFGEGREMIKLGVTLSMSGLIGMLVAYLVLTFVSSQGGEDEMGYYGAGIVILNTYVGLIFNAMSTDYFPRLAAVCEDLKAVVKTVFEQAFIAILLITPIVVVFIAFAPLMIEILYSGAFEPTVGLVRWGIVGMVFKAVSWTIGYVIIAKGDSSLFMKTAIGFNIVLLALNVAGYHYFGLEGIGMSMLIYFAFHFVAVRIITYYRYGFKMSAGFYPIFMMCLLLCALAFGSTYIDNDILKYSILIALIGISCLYSFRLLDKKIGFKTLISTILRKKK